MARAGLLLAMLVVSAACTQSDAADPAPSPRPRPSVSLRHPTEYFDLTEDQALRYLERADERAVAALHDGVLGALHDVYTRDGEARRVAADTILRDFRNGWINRTTIEVERTDVITLEQHLAVFEQTRIVRPCVYDLNSLEVVSDGKVIRETVRRYLEEEDIDWRLARDEVLSSEPTGERVTDCPPS